MILTNTNIVIPDDERPIRRDGTCTYCSAKMGTEHNEGCVILSRTIVVRMEIDVVVDVPRHWTKDDVDSFYNEGSRCSDNMIQDLIDWIDIDDNNRTCACAGSSFVMLREATEEDHRDLPVIGIEERPRTETER